MPPVNPTDVLDILVPIFFLSESVASSEEFQRFLRSIGTTTMANVYTLGAFQSGALTSIFGEYFEEFLPQLAMLQTLADYIKMHMPELVNTQAQQSKLTWKKIESNGYNSNHFAIHMRAVHDSYVETLSSLIQGNDNDEDEDHRYGRLQWKSFNTSKMTGTTTTQESKVKEWTSIHTKVGWNAQPNTFKTFKSAIESWAIQNSLDYIVDPDFISTYMDHAQPWKATKKELIFLEDISLKQFMHDWKVLYGAIKSGTRISSPNNKYIVDHACDKDGVITWYKFLKDYNGEDNICAKMTDLMLDVE